MSGGDLAGASSRSLFEPGTVINGKFRVDHVVGEGGMGVVVAATHLQLGERVALKFLRREAMKNEDVVARFAQEARSAVRLKSQYVARVLDVGTWDDIPFMVMEFLDGRDLGNVLGTTGALPIDEAVEYVVQACEGLAEAHARGIVHRDVKPENIFLTEHDGWRSIKLLDFGISKAALSGLGSEVSTVKTSAIMGSPCYMSPEQLRSTKNVDHRADIWSLGAVLFELLAGATPYDANVSLTELVATVLEQPPANLRGLRPDVPVELEQVVLRCLEKDPAKRFQSVAQLAVALLPFAPRRARLAAERAISLTRSAGLSDPDLKLPPSVFPSALPSGAPSRPSGLRVPPALLPNEYRHSTPNHETGAALSTTSVEPRPVPLTRKMWPLALGLFALMGAASLGWALRKSPTDTLAKPAAPVVASQDKPPHDAPSSKAPAPPAAVATEAPLPSATAPEANEIAKATEPVQAKEPRSPSASHAPRAPSPRAPASAAGSTTAAPVLDIRLTR